MIYSQYRINSIDLYTSIMEQKSDKPLYRVSDADLEKINKICQDSDRYPNWRDFVNDSLDFFITLWETPSKTTGMIAKMWNDFTPEMKNHTKKTSLPFYTMMENMNKPNFRAEQNDFFTDDSEKDTLFGHVEEISPSVFEQVKKIEEKPVKSSTFIYRQQAFQRLKDDSENTKTYISEILQGSGFKKPSDSYPYDGYPLIWSFYSRILPVKIILSVLAHMLYESNDTSVSFEEFRIKSYDVAVYLSEILRNYENEHQVPRNRKISTGLPSPPLIDRSRYKDMAKSEASRDRFLDQFVGKERVVKKTQDKYFEGALNAMDLVHFKQDEQGEVRVYLSKKGAQFCTLTNPVIDNNNFERAISDEERDLFLEQVIPTFDLEKVLVDKVIKKIREANNNSDIKKKLVQVQEVDSLFEKEISDWVKKNKDNAKKYNLEKSLPKKNGINILQRSIRVATMGRLAEMKAVKWMIDSEGKSYFLTPEKSLPRISQ
jgi:hypothetical protein